MRKPLNESRFLQYVQRCADGNRHVVELIQVLSYYKKSLVLIEKEENTIYTRKIAQFLWKFESFFYTGVQ